MPRAEIILLQFDIAGHSKIQVSPRNLQQARKLLQKYISSLVTVQTESDVSWAGDGGWCWFEVKESRDFSLAMDAAVDILGMVPRINEILLRDGVINQPLAIRLSAETMNVELDDDPTHFCASQMNNFLKYEREIGLVNSLVMTRRISEHLQTTFQRRFDRWRWSPELETDLLVYDGARIRNEGLKQLKSRNTEQEELQAIALPVTIFEGDRYSELCRHAYADVMLDTDVANVESLRFLSFRNALANSVLDSLKHSDSTELRRHFESDHDLEMAVAASPYEMLNSVSFSRPVRSHDERFEDCEQRERERHHRHSVNINPLEAALNACNEDVHYKGGEEVRFFNASALGFVVEIGENTLLDHAMADSLRIRSVIGGVEPPRDIDEREEIHT